MNGQSNSSIVAVTSGDSRRTADLDALLDDRGRSRGLRRTLFGIVVLVLALIGWAVFTQVDEFARARGEVVPSMRVQVLQSRDGGSVVRVLVREGDRVVAGQPLIDIAAANVDSLKAQIDVKIASLEIDRLRLDAIRTGATPDFSAFRTAYPLIVEQAQANFVAEVASREAALVSRRSDVRQRRDLLSGAQQELEIVERQLREERTQVNRLEDGAQRGVVPLQRLSDARQQLLAIEQRRAQLMSRADELRGAIASANAEVERILAEFAQKTSTELSSAIEQFRELVAQRREIEDRQGRTDVKATVDGIVVDLPQTGEGAVIAPGAAVATIVPVGDEIVMEVMVPPRDIGFIRVGQKATVKIDSYDSARFGSIEGRVRRVAPTSTKLRESGAVAYKVELLLPTQFVGSAERRLIPGMTGEADITTGRKSVMQYLLKPVFLAADTAFHER